MLLAITRAKPFTTGAAHRGCAGGRVTALFGVQTPTISRAQGLQRVALPGAL